MTGAASSCCSSGHYTSATCCIRSTCARGLYRGDYCHHSSTYCCSSSQSCCDYSAYNYEKYQRDNIAGAYTHKALKSYKTLESYKYFVAGFVKEVLVLRIPESDVYIFVSKVSHSQRLSEKPLAAWVAVKPDGDVVCGYCSCMAGLGECCSHVSATLFAIETGVRIRAEETCTSVACSWLAPSSGQNVEYLETYKIDFTNPATKVKRESGQTTAELRKDSSRKTRELKQPIDYDAFYRNISASGSVVLSVIEPYCEDFVPKPIRLNLPNPLSDLYCPDFEDLSREDLTLKVDAAVNSLKVSREQINMVEQETRTQSMSSSWFRPRAGRITASNMKAAARTNPDNPSKSLIKRICYPESSKFSTKATRWGCEHEAKVRNDYIQIFKHKHINLEVKECGFFIHEEYPYIGASPDGLVSCSCCGLGLIEIKCPFCHNNSSILEAADDKLFCLETVNGQTLLKKQHAYYFQIQCQLGVTGREYCDFCVWTGKELFIQRIVFDSDFFQDTLEHVTAFFKKCVLPELLAKYYSRMSQDVNVVRADVTGQKPICFCKTVDNNKTLIQCASENCSITYFHKECMGLKNKRKGWLCTNCRVLLKRKAEEE